MKNEEVKGGVDVTFRINWKVFGFVRWAWHLLRKPVFQLKFGGDFRKMNKILVEGLCKKGLNPNYPPHFNNSRYNLI
jgi:hypothetical protein